MTIGEFAKRSGIIPSTLRYYEDKGLIRVRRDMGNRRDYSEADVEWVKFIKRLKDTGMSLAEIRHYSNLRYQGESTMPDRLTILYRHRRYVAEQQDRWREYAKNLDDKITWYEAQCGKP